MANEGIELAIFKPSDLTNPYAILPGRQQPKCLDEIGGVGGGGFFVSYSDPKTQDPEVLRSRNICKVKVDGEVVDAFVLVDREATIIGSGENRDRGRQVSGGGLKSLFDDARVAPYGGVKKNSKDDRYFNFASEQGSWYVAADWISPYVYGTVNVDTRWGVDRVKKWPEKAKNAKWIWAAPYQALAPDDFCYFRWKVNASSAGLYAIYVTADDYFELYVDGEQLAKSNLNTSASYEAARIEVALSAGDHVIGFKARNIIAPGFNGPAALASALFSIADDKKETFIGQSGSGDWKALPYPAQEPGWTAGEVLLKLLDEAQTRGVFFPSYFTKTFTATTDSKSTAWAEKLAWVFKVGESYSSVLNKLEDLYEVWINPMTFELNMAPQRGTNRSTGTSPVQLVIGRDLVEAKTQAQGRIKNSLLVKSLEGWTTEADSASIALYGRLEDTLDTGTTQSMAKRLSALVFSSRAQEEIGATYRVLSPKYKPNRDYFVGDWVLAPNERGEMVPRRIVSLSYEENSAGVPIPTVEFDTIFQSNEARLNKAVGKLGGGGAGGSLGNVAGSTPGVGGTVELPPTSSPLTLFPMAPTGLVATSAGTWSANGVYPQSTITLTWAAVTQYEDESALIPDYYVVEQKLTSNADGWETVGKYYTNTAVIPAFTPGQSWDFRVSAVDKLGTQGQPSTSVTQNPVGPTSPMAKPTTPTLSSGLGMILAKWDGKLNDDIEPPPQFRYVYAEMSTAASGQPWVRVGGSIQRGGGQIQVSGETIGATRWIRFTAIDGVGILSAVSTSASVVVEGVVAGDIDQAIIDAITGAQSGADAAGAQALAARNDALDAQTQALLAAGLAGGKGSVWAQPDAPDAGWAAVLNPFGATVPAGITAGLYEGTPSWAHTLAYWDEVDKIAYPAGAPTEAVAGQGRTYGCKLETAGATGVVGTVYASFTFNKPAFGIMVTSWASTDVTIMVDRAPVSASAIHTTGVAGYQVITVEGLSAGTHQIDVAVGWGANFLAVMHQADATLTPGAVPAFRLGLTGDSYADSGIAPDFGGLALELWKRTGWTIVQLGQGSTGYTNDGASSGNTAKEAYGGVSRMAAAVAGDLDALLVLGSVNDGGSSVAALQAAATAYYAQVGLELDVPVIVAGVEPLNLHGESPVWWDQLNAGLLAAAEAAENVVGVIDWRGEAWLTGTGSVSTPRGDGNQDIYVGDSAGIDTIHLNQAGNAHVAGLFVARFVSLGFGQAQIDFAHDLWIDTTGGANTPHRWDGADWVPVTDKVATDAAAQAATALAAYQATVDAIGWVEGLAVAALESASGRNTFFDSAGTPGQYDHWTGNKVGDVWRMWTAINPDGSLPSGAKLVAEWRWSGTAWEPAPIDETYLPLVNIGEGTYGSLTGNRMAANTITAREVIIADWSNLFPNPQFRDGGAGWSIPSYAQIVTSGTENAIEITGATGTYRSFRPDGYTPVQPGERYFLSAVLEADAVGTAGTFGLYVSHAHPVTGVNTFFATVAVTNLTDAALTTDGVTVSGVVTIPAGGTIQRIRPYFEISNSSAPNGWKGRVKRVMWRRMASAELIVDGAITTRALAAEAVEANNIKAGTITVNELSPSIGDDLVLSANNAITTIVNTQSDQANQIANVQDTANNAAQTAQTASTTAGNAQSAVNTLDTKVTAVDVEQKNTKNAVNNLQTWFRVDAAGAHVGQTGSIFQTHILPHQFNITENDVVTTYWESGRMVVPSLVADKMTLTNFTFEAYAGGMVIRLG